MFPSGRKSFSVLSNDVNPVDVGKRLRLARETAGITQADAALTISVGRTTLVAIEKGQRKIRIKELQMLAAMYSTSVNTLLRPESKHVNLVPQFRKHFRSKDELVNSDSKFVDKFSEKPRLSLRIF